MGCRTLSALVSAAASLPPSMTLLFSGSFLTYFFFLISLSLCHFYPVLTIFSQRHHIYDSEAQLCPVVGCFGASWIPLCQHGAAPVSSLRAQSCSSSLSTPGHSHTTQPPTSQDPAITSRQHYTQGTDLSALLCVILPLCLSWSLCQERQVEGMK